MNNHEHCGWFKKLFWGKNCCEKEKGESKEENKDVDHSSHTPETTSETTPKTASEAPVSEDSSHHHEEVEKNE